MRAEQQVKRQRLNDTLDAECWCRRAVVPVPRQDIMAGLTGSCSKRCKQVYDRLTAAAAARKAQQPSSASLASTIIGP